MKVLLAVVFASAVFAQNYEIRGAVAEYGPNTPVAGATVSVSEFVTVDNVVTRKEVASIFTTAPGTFAYKSEHPGRFYVEATKDGYLGAVGGILASEDEGSGQAVELSEKKMSSTMTLTLARPSTITGRVIDQDGKPVSGAYVRAFSSDQSVMSHMIDVRTDEDGVFVIDRRIPGSYAIGVDSPHKFDDVGAFDETRFKTVASDFEQTFWPGGVTDQKDALPLPIQPGATTNMGTLRLRQSDLYRLRLTNESKCAPKESWQAVLLPADRPPEPGITFVTIPCAANVMLSRLKPGSYNLGVWSGRTPEELQWSLTSFTVTNKNVEATLHFAPPVRVDGRIKMSEGRKLPSLAKTGMMLSTGFSQRVILSPPPMKIDPDGTFSVPNVAWPQAQLRVSSLPAGMYVQQVLYGGKPVEGRTLDLAEGAQLVIILDDQPASLSGRVMDGDKPAPKVDVLLMTSRLPEIGAPLDPSLGEFYHVSATEDGSYSFPVLPPGPYRLVAIPSAAFRVEYTPSLDQVMRGGRTITLERGGAHVHDIKLSRVP